MRFTPKSDEQIKKESNFSLFPKGDYDFEIKQATDKVSSARNEMIELRVTVYNSEGSSRGIFDYLIESVIWKVHHCAQACGLEAEYNAGKLEAYMFEGKVGRCKVVITPAKGEWPEKNTIADYIVPDVKISDHTRAAYTKTKPQPKSADLDDEIPF